MRRLRRPSTNWKRSCRPAACSEHTEFDVNKEGTMQKAKRQNYLVGKNDLPVRTAAPSAAAHKGIVMSTQRVYGVNNSIMFAARGPGYHTKPHRHECEQINYIVEGEMWF